ncbi:hypothetical protein ACTXL6_21925 [Brachybacterium tyrofermentans]|uniref:hypothetical protein n=1 Tax=Brachybacterium tyrofermentans TaxID=47848 RepID=UPI003FD4C8F6
MSEPAGETASAPDAGKSNPAQGKVTPASDVSTDPVVKENQAKAADEAAQHSDVEEAQASAAQEAGGYGH